MSQGASVGTAARGAGYSRRSVYRWRGADAELAAAWESALEAGTDGLEDEALRRAKDGWAEPRFYQNKAKADQPLSSKPRLDVLLVSKPMR